MKKKLHGLFYGFVFDKNGVFHLNKGIVLLTFLTLVIELALCSIHNKAAYSVYSTVAIFSFFAYIMMIVAFVSSLRLKERGFYRILLLVSLVAALILMGVYVYRIFTDVYYVKAIGGEIGNPAAIIYSIDDSGALMIAGMVLELLALGLSVAEMILEGRRKHGKRSV